MSRSAHYACAAVRAIETIVISKDISCTFFSLHIAGGALALSGAVGTPASPKGGRWHLYFGRTFAVVMLTVVVTALPMAIVRPNLFLFLVGIFSGYLVLTGWLCVRNRSGVPRLVDWVAAGAMAVAAVVMCIWGVIMLCSGHSMGVVLLVFERHRWRFCRNRPVLFQG